VRLGERASGTVRLEEAVTAYREALQERTREQVPLDWAMTQNNLGNALSRCVTDTVNLAIADSMRQSRRPPRSPLLVALKSP
jgi:hypothetical protein